MESTANLQMETMAIKFPKVDLKRLKGIAKAMGWTIQSLDYYESPQFYADLDEAEQAIANGEGKVITSEQDLDALFV